MMAPAGPVLRDIHVAHASWWPLAPGWWIVAALAVAVIAGLAWYVRRARLPRRRWRSARRELARLARQDADRAAFAAGVSRLLRRAARLRDPATAGLHGAPWHAALRRLAGGRIATGILENLDAAMYRRDAVFDTVAVEAAAARWLRRVLLHGRAHA